MFCLNMCLISNKQFHVEQNKRESKNYESKQRQQLNLKKNWLNKEWLIMINRLSNKYIYIVDT